ncbi:lysophospholipase L1-like esterase [Scopulibacillus darangshiensis]|uniref:Lysophospholipase L1-like esterase n=1 Tax=Scopulibacillus darangshiensis TaxID=442528 RepID=A0A4V2SLH8_9BACL|nr:GDSL-type esterase/lipase family protein [Scopulibacillus darangshiensis]TCP23486.1 lysophospholipase L1-like esterase [Scopulibacillus darangshiensis]
MAIRHIYPQQPLLYTALGDSLTVGVGTAIFTPGFTGRYRELSEQALNTSIYQNVYAKIGATSGEILQILDLPEVTASIRTSKIITITAGANDLIDAGQQYLITKDAGILEKALKTSMANISRIINRIHAVHNPKNNNYIIRLLNLYNPFPNIPAADPWIERFNRHLTLFGQEPHIAVADIYHAFAGRQNALLSSDHIHPNAEGYNLMAKVTAELGYDHLRN